jgi:hypothetical protein
MALKLEISTAVTDHEMAIKAIERIQKGVKDLGEISKAAGGSMSAAFTDINKVLESLDKNTASFKSVKSLTEELKDLTSRSANLKSFGQDLGDTGKMIQQALGSQTQAVLRDFKKEIGDIQKLIATNLAKAQDPETILYSPRDAHAAALEAERGMQIKKDAEQRLWRNEPRDALGGRSFAQAGGILGKAAIGLTMANTALMAGYQYSLSDDRYEILRQRTAMQAGREAAAGDPTLAIIKALGIGNAGNFTASNTLGTLWAGTKGAATLGGLGAMIGGLGLMAASPFTAGASAVTGATLFASGAGAYFGIGGGKGAQEHYAEMEAQLNSIDKEKFYAAIEPGYKRMMSYYSGDAESMRQFGDARYMSSMRTAKYAGVFDDEAMRGFSTAAIYGGSSNIDPNLMKLGRHYGVSNALTQQGIRLGGYGGNYGQATQAIQDMVGGSGVSGNRAAVGLLSNALAQGSQNVMSTDLMAGANAATLSAVGAANASTGGTRQYEATVAGLGAVDKYKADMMSTGSGRNTFMTMALQRFGLGPQSIAAAISLWTNEGPEAAITFVQNHSGKSREVIAAALSGAESSYQKAVGDMTEPGLIKGFGGNKKAAIGWLEGGHRAVNFGRNKDSGELEFTSMFIAGTVAAGKAIGAPSGKLAPAANIGLDKVKEDESKMQATELESLKNVNDTLNKIGTTLWQVVGESLKQTGQEVLNKSMEIQQQTEDIKNRRDGVKNRPFSGRKER